MPVGAKKRVSREKFRQTRLIQNIKTGTQDEGVPVPAETRACEKNSVNMDLL